MACSSSDKASASSSLQNTRSMMPSRSSAVSSWLHLRMTWRGGGGEGVRQREGEVS